MGYHVVHWGPEPASLSKQGPLNDLSHAPPPLPSHLSWVTHWLQTRESASSGCAKPVNSITKSSAKSLTEVLAQQAAPAALVLVSSVPVY